VEKHKLVFIYRQHGTGNGNLLDLCLHSFGRQFERRFNSSDRLCVDRFSRQFQRRRSSSNRFEETAIAK
jgi:hypothetical protein